MILKPNAQINLKPELYTRLSVSTAVLISPWPELKAAGSVGEQKPSERAMNPGVYAIITAANEAPDRALTTP